MKQTRFWMISLTAMVAIATSTLLVYSQYINDTKNEELLKHRDSLSEKLESLMAEKQKVILATAMTLSENQIFKHALKSNLPIKASSMQALIDKLEGATAYRNIWIQMIDSDGISRFRTWTKKKNDDLLAVRKDLRQVYQYPQPTTSFSVGKFTLSFKAIVPIFEKGDFLGVVEIITQTNSIDKALMIDGIESAVLVTPAYRKQLTKAITKRFISDFYVANENVSNSNLQLLSDSLFENWVSNTQYRQIGDKMAFVKPLLNVDNHTLGYWVFFQKEENLPSTFIDAASEEMAMVLIAINGLSLLVILLLYYRRIALAERHFFFDVFDNSTEVIFVADRDKVMEANAAFYQLFDNVENLAEFESRFNSVADSIVPEEGYVQKEMDGWHWLDFVYKNADYQNYVKIRVGVRDYIFLVKVAKVNFDQHGDGELYSVLMTDMTEVEETKRELERLSVTDSLTGIHNRYYFNHRAEQEIQRAHRYQNNICFLMFDLDHFKKINDTYGHDVGDQVLVTITDVVKHSLRETDFFCRVGGEEFVVIMPETNMENALIFAERLRNSVLDCDVNKVPERVSISIGVVQLKQWENLTNMYKRLDNALYSAKEHGRNRVEHG